MSRLPLNNSNPFSMSIEETASHWNTDAKKGLSTLEADSRLKLIGKNELQEQVQKSVWLLLLSQFQNIVVYLLLIAGIVSFAFENATEGVAILMVIFINAAIGFGMELQANRSMTALKKLDKVMAKVWREGRMTEIVSEELVPGDVLYLEAGDLIAADARLIAVSSMEVNESSLTGESLPVIKHAEKLPENIVVADRKNMLFKGTAVAKGNGKAIVTATGMNTELGKISKLVHTAGKDEIPLNTKLRSFSKKLILFAFFIALPLVSIGFMNGTEWLLMIETTLALIVAAIPEGLPIVSTIALANGMLQLAKHNVIVKKLAAVETLGSTNVIFTDKTGTLTQNRLEATTICLSGMQIDIQWNEANRSLVFLPSTLSVQTKEELLKLFHVAALCNNASFTDPENALGDPMEIALLKLGEYHKKGFLEEIDQQFPRIYEQPFDSETKMMGTIHESGDKMFVAVKGAVEEILKHSTDILIENKLNPFSESAKQEWHQHADELAKKGLRVLAFAYKDEEESREHFINNLTFAGLIGFLDLPREEVPQALLECKEAGIRIVMVTGDHSETAKSIALKIGLTSDPDEKVMHGSTLFPNGSLTEKERFEILNTLIFSRVSPSQKLELVSLFQKENWIAAMTGDGVNDAPALRKADIGIAMGKRGTQVAREAADMILQDDSFASIAKAVKYGRVIYDNIRTFIVYLLSCNLSEIMVVAIAGFMNLSLPIQPLQILFLNIVTDVFPALALGMTEGSPFVMKQKPRNPSEPIINNRKWISIFVYALSLSLSVLSVFWFAHYQLNYSPQLCNNIAFFSLAFAQLLHPFNLVSVKESFFKNEITHNLYVWLAIAFCVFLILIVYFVSPFNQILSLQPLQSKSWLLIAIGSVLHLFLIQFFKRLKLVD